MPLEQKITLDNSAFQKIYSNKILKERREIMPEILVTFKSGIQKRIDVSFGSDAEKDLMILAIENYLRKKDAVQYTVVSETWIGSGYSNLRPSSSLCRKEGLAYTTWTKDGSNLTSLWEIKISETGARFVEDIASEFDGMETETGSIMKNLFIASPVKMTSTLKRKVDKLTLSLIKKEKVFKD